MSDTCVSTGGITAQRTEIGDLSRVPWHCPQAMLDEHRAATVIGVSVKSMRRWRCDGSGPRYMKVNGCTVRYRLGDLLTWLESQPVGGGAVAGERAKRRGPGRPRKDVA